MIKLVRVVQTCIACPSQWDAWDEFGQYYYLRYRHGHGRVEAFSGPHWIGTDEIGNSIAQFEHGDKFSGFMTLSEFAYRAGLDISEVKDYVPWEDTYDYET